MSGHVRQDTLPDEQCKMEKKVLIRVFIHAVPRLWKVLGYTDRHVGSVFLPIA